MQRFPFSHVNICGVYIQVVSYFFSNSYSYPNHFQYILLSPPPNPQILISLSSQRPTIPPAIQFPGPQTATRVNLLFRNTMSSVLCSHNVILAAAMAVSGAVVLLSFGRQRIFPATHLPETQIPTSRNRSLRSCLSTGTHCRL